MTTAITIAANSAQLIKNVDLPGFPNAGVKHLQARQIAQLNNLVALKAPEIRAWEQSPWPWWPVRP
jgi:hypothetical protein